MNMPFYRAIFDLLDSYYIFVVKLQFPLKGVMFN